MIRFLIKSFILIALLTSGMIRMTQWLSQGIPSRELAYQESHGGMSHIHLIDIDRRLSVRLTHDETLDIQPVWSPDGSRIAFTSLRDDSWDVYIMDSNGRNLWKLTDERGRDSFPQWSPDGQTILFASSRDSIWNLFTLNLNDFSEVQLTWDEGDNRMGAWSPDGTRIAFTGYYGSYEDVYIMDADGTNISRLTDAPGDDGSLHWSTDGTRILWATESVPERDRCTGREGRTAKCLVYASFFSMNPDGSDVIRHTPRRGVYWTPRYSPDGHWIAYAEQSRFTQKWNLHLMNLDSTIRIAITNQEVNESTPAWRPLP